MYKFPRGMRPSSLDERREFYRKEFDMKSLNSWLEGRRRRTKLAMVLGRHTGIVVEEHVRDKDNVVIIDDWRNAIDVRRYALDYLPESMYYDRNRYRDVAQCAKCGKRANSCRDCYNYDGQQLAFDLDPENVDCPYHGHIGQKIARGGGLSFCMLEFNAVKKQAILLSEDLRKDYRSVDVVYSGRGFHVVVDDESGYLLTARERKTLARRIGRRYSIDEWVTAGGSRLLRLPYSLNGLVSRKCVIIKDLRDLLSFDPRSSNLVVPAFARLA
ncbi:MAG: DNA primase [Thermoplasmata archaeon]